MRSGMRAKRPRQLLSSLGLVNPMISSNVIGSKSNVVNVRSMTREVSLDWKICNSCRSIMSSPSITPRLDRTTSSQYQSLVYGTTSKGKLSQAAQYSTNAHVKRDYSSWPAALQTASNIVTDASSFTMSPTKLVADEMKSLTSNIKALLSSGHPSLDKMAKYYVKSEGKHLRPLVVLLMARATSEAQKADRINNTFSRLVNTPISPTAVLQDHNPTAGFLGVADAAGITSSQRRLAEITEMIHAASLLHDDVIDNAETRRGSPSGNLAFGNKMAILAGDFLLGRASVALARLRDAEVTELIATSIANLIEGEFMQLENSADHNSGKFTENTFDYYLQKTYLKSASLISKSCRASALLGGCAQEVVDAAYMYGKNLGLSFQLVDDMLDYTVSGDELGKPARADLKLGLATAPVLFAWEEFEELGPMVERKFSQPGDVEKAWELVQRSDGLARTKQLAENFSSRAIEALSILPDSDAKEGLVQICLQGLVRRK